jgi:8-hydroxy-5-deazaflavin:NADPH oxidoreductase
MPTLARERFSSRGDVLDTTIIGTGDMAHAIGARLLGAGQKVTVVGRSAERAGLLAAALAEGDDDAGAVNTADLAEPIRGEVVILALPYEVAVELAAERGEELRGKIVVDLTNPVDWDTMDGFVTPSDSSGAEEIARRLRDGAGVIKAFNTTFANRLARVPGREHPLDVWIAGDDEAAKAKLAELLRGTGLRVVDTGGLRRARELEAIGLLHILLQARLATGFQTAISLNT